MFFQQMSVLSFILVAFSKKTETISAFADSLPLSRKKSPVIPFQLQTDFSLTLTSRYLI